MSRFSFTGRIVQGDPNKMQQKKDDKTGQPRLRKDGSPLMQAYIALAIPKNPAQRLIVPGLPSYEESRAIIDGDARAAWPQFFGTRNPNVQYRANLPLDCTNPTFANKIIDGDGFDDKGQPFSANEGWAGCWVIKFSNGFAPKVMEWTANGWAETVHTGRTVKCGDYATVSGDCSSNQSTDSPGMYMNFDTVGFEQEGAFIAGSNSVDPNAALGQRGGAGAPPANAGAGQTGGPAHGQANGGTASAPGPYSGYRDPAANGAGAPPPPGDAAPSPPAGPQMTAAAQFSYDQYKASGWTDDQLRANGFMV